MFTLKIPNPGYRIIRPGKNEMQTKEDLTRKVLAFKLGQEEYGIDILLYKRSAGTSLLPASQIRLTLSRA